ncbi:NepR family anti-sigma factor [Rhizobium sp. LEGMi135b]
MTIQNHEDADKKTSDLRAMDILDPNNQIGNRLRSFYAAAQDEAIPDRFLDLLEKLDQAESLASAKVSE